MQDDSPHYVGHRKRLKQRLFSVPPESWAEYELLELVLFFAIPRKDVKPLAKKLLYKFGNLFNVINSSKDQLLEIEGINDGVHVIFFTVKELINRLLKHKVTNQNIISSWNALLDYLKTTMSNLKLEQFRILFLNKKNILIADEVMNTGTIDQAPVYPREIIKRALFYEASAIILVHNHPSGDIKPSKADIELTNKIVETCGAVNIAIHDHVIIGNNRYYSFKSNMLL